MRCADSLAPIGTPPLISRTSAATARKSGDDRPRPERDVGADGLVVEEWTCRELGRDDLDRVPRRELVARHPHRRQRTVMADLGEAVRGELADVTDEWFLRCAVWVLVGTLVCGSVVRLRVLACPLGNLVGVDQYLISFHINPRGEAVESLAVVVRADAGAIRVVPAVQPAHEVVTDDRAVRHQCAAMEATPIENRVFVAVSNDHKIDISNQRARRRAVGQSAPASDSDGGHGASPLLCVRRGDHSRRAGRQRQKRPDRLRRRWREAHCAYGSHRRERSRSLRRRAWRPRRGRRRGTARPSSRRRTIRRGSPALPAWWLRRMQRRSARAKGRRR
jgi:hypothetical protein